MVDLTNCGRHNISDCETCDRLHQDDYFGKGKLGEVTKVTQEELAASVAEANLKIIKDKEREYLQDLDKSIKAATELKIEHPAIGEGIEPERKMELERDDVAGATYLPFPSGAAELQNLFKLHIDAEIDRLKTLRSKL